MFFFSGNRIFTLRTWPASDPKLKNWLEDGVRYLMNTPQMRSRSEYIQNRIVLYTANDTGILCILCCCYACIFLLILIGIFWSEFFLKTNIKSKLHTSTCTFPLKDKYLPNDKYILFLANRVLEDRFVLPSQTNQDINFWLFKLSHNCMSASINRTKHCR